MIGNKENDLTLFDFQNSFSTVNDCLEYLANDKWKDGYVCKNVLIRAIVKELKIWTDNVLNVDI